MRTIIDPRIRTRVSVTSRNAVSVARMQAIDRAAIEHFRIPRLLLMEHAGLALARAVRPLQPRLSRPILVCCGTGFNGGDGLAAARHLYAWGYPLRVLLTDSCASLRNEPAVYAAILRRLGVAVTECASVRALGRVMAWWNQCALLVDALLGIGIRGMVREPTASVIERMNRSGRPIVSADVPSGLNADTGEVHGMAVKATLTVTFGFIKRGCLIEDGPAHTGSLLVDPITLPPQLLTRTHR